MKTEKFDLTLSNDAEYATGCPQSLSLSPFALEALLSRSRELYSALSLAKADLIVDEFQSDGLIEYDDKGLKIESDFVCYLEVSSNGEIKLRFVSSYNKAAWASTHICFVDVKGADYGVTFTLSDGDKKMPVRVAYNGTVASGEMLIYSETAFGGAFEAPIGILLTDGKLDVRVWQPEDMGTDPTSVTIIKPYGLYDMEAIACDLKEIGSEKDYDQLFRQKGFDNGEVAATAKIDVDGETYDIVVGVVGDQEVYANYAENEDEEEMLVPLDEDGTQKRLHREPSDLLQAKALESEHNKTYLAWRANCWLNIEILKNGDSVGNYGDQFGSSFGSIQECFESVCEDDIRQMLGQDISKEEKSPFYNIRFSDGVDLESKCDAVCGIYNPYETVAWANYKDDGKEYEVRIFIKHEDERLGFNIFLHGEQNVDSVTGMTFATVKECFDEIEAKGLTVLRVETKIKDAKALEPTGEEFCQKDYRGLEEGCPHCDATVELEYIFYAQPCPNCGEMILPCNNCPYMDSDTYLPEMCGECPLSSQIEDSGIELFMKMSRDQRLELMKKLGVEDKRYSEAFEACFKHLSNWFPRQKDLENALENARVGYYLGILGDHDAREILNKHADIYPYEDNFEFYDTEWFVENKEAFVEFIEQVILREAAKGV